MTKTKKSSKAYFITQHLPNDSLPQFNKFNYDEMTPEQAIEICKLFNEYWWKSPTNQKDPNNNGIMSVLHIAPTTGTYHIHAMISKKDNVKEKEIISKFPKADRSPAYKETKNISHYFNKDTAQCKSQTIGNYFVTDKDFKNSYKNKNDYVKDRLIDGAVPTDLIAEDFYFARNAQAIWNMNYAIHLNMIPRTKPVSAYWHCGLSGTGKTYAIRKYLKDNNIYDNTYIPILTSKSPWDNYDFVQHNKAIMLEDLKPEFLMGTTSKELFLLLFEEDTRINLPARYENKLVKNWEEVHVASVYGPEDIYIDFGQDTSMQLIRRLTKIYYHAVDNNFPKSNPKHWLVYTMDSPQTNYKNITQLKRKAEEFFGYRIDPAGALIH